jgi:cytochrome P450
LKRSRAGHEYAEPLPVSVISELLGVPEPDRKWLRPWSAAIVKLYELGYTEEQQRAANDAVRNLLLHEEHWKRLTRDAREHPETQGCGGPWPLRRS